MTHLKDKGIQSSIHYPPIHKFKFYRENFKNSKDLLSITEDITKREVTLPLYPSMSDGDISYVCEMIKEYLTKR
jgi:dTDP-4-amino-4,6-dideoxygalactose transaminase